MNKAALITALTGLVILLFATSESRAAVPNLINYQGMLLDSTGSPLQGNKLVKYTIYDKTGSEIWNSGFINTTFTDGLFTAQLGASPQPVLPADMCTDDSSLTLGVTVDVNPEFSPRTRLVTAPYAFESDHAGSVDWSGVTNVPADLADGDNGGIIYSAGSGLDLTGSIFSIEPDGINASHVALDGVGSSEIADNNVTSTDIANNTIFDADINTSAAIAATKINGTAATLSATQTFTGTTNTFTNNLIIGDSTFRANATGISIGSALVPTGLRMVSIERDYSTTGIRYGTYIDFSNTSTGTLYGGYANLLSTGNGAAYGFYGNVTSDNVFRTGLYGRADANAALTSGESFGVYGMGLDANSSYGVFGVSQGASSTYSYGVAGIANAGTNRYGVYGNASGGTVNYAGYFSGNVHVTNTLTKGGGAFRIDHPLDPENKFLQHSFVESPDMMNIYNGNVVTDSKGEAVVTLPDWFTALNIDYRYQLTSIGAPGPNLYIKEEVTDNKFIIAGAQPNAKVSWQVTGIRNDKFAQANRIQVEVDKRSEDKGEYAHPEAFGLNETRGIDYQATHRELNIPAEADSQE
ncbi:MAG TPA: hypothetical protein VHP63_05625 [candidate division Zixibacteria bacterium]|nr:hypothetical protein [candidate division Zixibacteria bacterium]